MGKVNKAVDSRPRRTLRSTVVEPFKQIKFGVYVMMVSFAFLVSAALMIGYAFYQQYSHVMEIFSVVDPSTKWELVTNDIFYANAIKLTLLCLVFVAVLFTVVFKMTHKFYGPLIGIERFIDHVTLGDYSKRVGIRRGDELQRLVGKLNLMAETLEKKYGIPDRRKSERKDDDPDSKVS